MAADTLPLDLCAIVEDGKSYTLEELSRRVGRTQGQVHRALTLLCRKSGWGMRPVNQTPYERVNHQSDEPRAPMDHPVYNRGRAKGEKNTHDPHEPFWLRTRFRITRPQ